MLFMRNKRIRREFKKQKIFQRVTYKLLLLVGICKKYRRPVPPFAGEITVINQREPHNLYFDGL